jgi:hypothetical protein
MQMFCSTTSSALLPSGNKSLIDAAGPKKRKFVLISQAARALPEILHIWADLAPPSVGRYQMKGDLQPADVTLHDAYLAATPTGSSVPCATTMMWPPDYQMQLTASPPTQILSDPLIVGFSHARRAAISYSQRGVVD